MTRIKAAVLHGAQDLRIEECELDAPGPDEVQVAVSRTTLCGSDYHYWAHGRNGSFALREPLVLGHESAGEIAAVGEGVAARYPHLQVGIRVALEAGQACTQCEFCLRGRYNLCPSLRFGSSAKSYPHLDGFMVERRNWPARLVHVLPDNVSCDLGALAEPLCVVIHAMRRGRVDAASSAALVIGAGAIGLLACALLRASGCSDISAVDIENARDKLDFATRNGWVDRTATLANPSAASDDDPHTIGRSKATADRLLSELGHADGFDVVVECSGFGEPIQTAVHAAKTGGKVLLIGMGTPNVMLPLSSAALREVELVGVFRYANAYPAALALLSSGKLGPIQSIITHRFRLEDSAQAFELMRAGRDADGRTLIKAVIES